MAVDAARHYDPVPRVYDLSSVAQILAQRRDTPAAHANIAFHCRGAGHDCAAADYHIEIAHIALALRFVVTPENACACPGS
jgi:hypothetical protein